MQLSMFDYVRDELLVSAPEDSMAIEAHFQPLSNLSAQLDSQLLSTLERGPELASAGRQAQLVAALRIIEHEENLDNALAALQHASPGRVGVSLSRRPKRLRQRALDLLRAQTARRFMERAPREGSAKLTLEKIQRFIYHDARFVQKELVPCYPPHYEILRLHISVQHKQLHEVVSRLMARCNQFESSDVLAMFDLSHVYESTMRSPEIGANPDWLQPPLVDEDQLNRLIGQYIVVVRGKMREWSGNIVGNEIKDWFNEANQKVPKIVEGLYETDLIQDLFQMVDQHLEVAQRARKPQFMLCVVQECSAMLLLFQKSFEDEIKACCLAALRTRIAG